MGVLIADACVRKDLEVSQLISVIRQMAEKQPDQRPESALRKNGTLALEANVQWAIR